MLTRMRLLRFLVAMMVIVSFLPGCRTAEKVVDKYHTLIEKYQAARKTAASFRLCVDTAMGQMYVQGKLVQDYQYTDVEKAKVWRQALDNSSARVVEALSQYKDAQGNPIPLDKLDLGELAKKGALPDGIASQFTLFVQAFQEAPLPTVNPEPVLLAMRTASEQYNKIDACGADWQDAVEEYNVERNKVPGDVVGRLAEALNIKELPQELPYYAGDYTGTISQPKLPGQ